MSQVTLAPTEESDESLAELARNGDKAAFAELYDRYFKSIYDFSFRTVRDHADAGEVTQDSFIKAFRSIGQLNDPTRFRAWLFTITRSTALNHIRARRPVTVLPEDYEDLFTSTLGDESETKETSQIVWDAAAALSSSEYTLLDLHVRHGLGGVEIAREIDSTPNSVYVRLNRMKTSLRDSIVALMLARRAPGVCETLTAQLNSDEAQNITPQARRQINLHAESCEDCSAAAAGFPSELVAFGALAPIAAPAALKGLLLANLGLGAGATAVGGAGGAAGGGASGGSGGPFGSATLPVTAAAAVVALVLALFAAFTVFGLGSGGDGSSSQAVGDDATSSPTDAAGDSTASAGTGDTGSPVGNGASAPDATPETSTPPPTRADAGPTESSTPEEEETVSPVETSTADPAPVVSTPNPVTPPAVPPAPSPPPGAPAPSSTEVVVPTASPPNAVDDSIVTQEDIPVLVAAVGNDSDEDADLLASTASITGEPSFGSLANHGDGTFTYTPDPDQNGTDTFTYEVCDSGGRCGSATVTLTIEPVADAPVLNEDSVQIPEDTPMTVDVAANDEDVDGDLAPESADVATPPESGSLVNNGDGTFLYSPGSDLHGPDSFSYTLCDAEGLCGSATVAIMVTPENDFPSPVDDEATTLEDVSVVIDLLANDSDVDGDPLSLESPILTLPANGGLTSQGDGTVVYSPADDFNGPDEFTYQACDEYGLCSSATARISVTPVNDPPTAVDVEGQTTPEDTPFTVNVLLNDLDIDDNLDPSTTAIVSDASQGTLENHGDGRITYTPGANVFGPDEFAYQVCDEDGLCSSATTTIMVIPVSDPPIAFDDTATTAEDTPLILDLVFNDEDIDLDLLPDSVEIFNGPSQGLVVSLGGGRFTYTPNPNVNGSDGFDYVVCDSGDLCSSATVTLEITPVADPPVVVDASVLTSEDVPVVINAVSNDSDLDGDLVLASAQVLTGPAEGLLTADGDGIFTYTPGPNFNGGDSFSYEVCDATNLCGSATVSISVIAINDAPQAVSDSATTPADTAVLINATSNDLDVDGNLVPATALVIGGPSNGTVANHGDGTFTYTPTIGFNGADSFSYQVCDSDVFCDAAVVGLLVGSFSDIILVLSPLDAAVSAGSTTTYVITVTNQGTSTAGAATLTYSVTGSASLVSFTKSKGNCTLASPSMSCNFGALPGGESVTVTVDVSFPVVETVVHTATAATSAVESTLLNNSAATDTFVTP